MFENPLYGNKYLIISCYKTKYDTDGILPGQVNWTEILNLINFYFVPLDNKIFGFNPLYNNNNQPIMYTIE